MSITIKEIGTRVRNARLKKGRTQKQLAECLDRTVGAISQLEQGKIQISAVDLHKLANYLDTPIEYFFGEKYDNEATRDLIMVLRKQTPKDREYTLNYISSLSQLQELSLEIAGTPKDNVSEDQVRNFMELLVKFNKHNKISN